jgi:hypothetical protein
MRLLPIQAAQIGRVWPRVAPWLAAAERRAGCDMSADDLRRICARQEGQLVVVLDGFGRSVAAGVTQVRDYEGGERSCWVLRLGGRSGGVAWPEVIAQVETGASRLGCHAVEFVGRKAWRRFFPDYAARPDAAGFHFHKPLRAA